MGLPAEPELVMTSDCTFHASPQKSRTSSPGCRAKLTWFRVSKALQGVSPYPLPSLPVSLET